GEARDGHQFACLIGYGASAICPYLGVGTVRELIEQIQVAAQQAVVRAASDEAKLRKAQVELKEADALDYVKALKNYRAALEGGLLKIMSKMGISVLGSYHGAQIFEAVGIGDVVIEKCFDRTPSQVGGIGFFEIARESLARHAKG